MSKLRSRPLKGRPLLDIASYARRGPGRRDRLSAAELEQISLTVRRAPEAVLKVLPKDANRLSSVQEHLGYIGRQGKLELETDAGDHVQGKDIGRQLIEQWDLDLDEHRAQPDLSSAGGRAAPRLVHKLMLSMPPGTSPQRVLAAARNFLREEFALKHRYALVLHTDEPHPHVHVVVKAVSEQGIRLHIRKATLREWRREFARHLREQGIAANATDRAVRGETRTRKTDGIYRATLRGVSTHSRTRAEAVAAELRRGELRVEASKSKLVETRKKIERGWRSVSEILVSQGQPALAAAVRQFIGRLAPPQTDKERLAAALRQATREPRAHTRPRVR